MRLLDALQKEDYQPLERGEALPQFYENGDHHLWNHQWSWHWQFFYFLQNECRFHPYCPAERDRTGMLLMGGEL